MILDDVRWVTERSEHVHISRERIAQVCSSLDPADLRLPDWRIAVVPPARDERLVDWILLFNSINFCYWGEPKWTVEFEGERYDGAFGMMAALTRALKEGFPLLDGAFLALVSEEEFRTILRANAAIPLEAERLAIWHAAGPVLASAFGGKWHEVVRAAQGSAVELVRLLVSQMPSWDDGAEYDGRRIAFYKRAQLAAGMIYQAFGGEDWGAFVDFYRLSVYSDYKLPQVLRRLGILTYSAELAGLVDRCIPIPAGRRMEVEIRAATVWAGELMRQALQPRSRQLTAAHVDYWLWSLGQVKAHGDLPYHRTRTTAY